MSKPCRYCDGELEDVGGGFHQCQDCGRQVANRFLSDQ